MAAPTETPKKYTTVGSIYNPSSTPLQPPTRRGRAVKWPLHADLAIAKSPLFGASFAAEPRSPPPAAAPLHYSPLQQNYDRAVSPVGSQKSLGRSGAPSASVYHSGTAELAKLGVAEMADQSDQEEDEEQGGNADLTKQMSVKTLTNLASYENPMQRAAQKMLSRALTLPLTGAKSVRSDPGHLENMLPPNGTGDLDLRSFNFNYDTILAKGPGAPLPLTAGPPGLRQHKSMTLDPGTPGSRVSAQAGCLAIPQSSALRSISRQSQYSSLREAVDSATPPFPIALSSHDDASFKIIDTLTAEEADQYYPGGLPNNFNYKTKRDGGLPAPSARDLELRREKTNRFWHAGNEMLSKSMDLAIAEKNRRDFQRSLDFKLGGAASVWKTVNRKISVREAIATPTGAHAAPLLSMAFQTLINHPEFSGRTDLPKFSFSAF